MNNCEIKSLINNNICKEIIYDSDLNKYVNIESIPINKIDEYFLQCIDLLKTKPKLYEQFIKESIENINTKYHKENLITHLYCVGWICSLFSNKYNLDSQYAYKLGFFHDIGKPWAKKYIQTKKKIISNSKGHSQIGENICWELGLDKKICWCVSNHMCSCCHENNSELQWEYVGSLQCISLEQNLTNKEILEYANSLACLMIGDNIGRIGEIEKNIENIISHSKNWLKWFNKYIENYNRNKNSVKFLTNLHSDNSIIVQTYGHSGFGKSTGIKNLIEKLNEYNITWELASRDQSYYNIYFEETGIDLEISNNSNYIKMYDYIELNDLKKKVQLDWIKQLNSILESDSKVKIIDTVQLIYPKSWESTLNSLDSDSYSVWKSSLKLGYYGFPQSLYGIEFEPKTKIHQLIPRDITDGLTWPNINSELDERQEFNPEIIDIGYGSIEFLSNTIINYNSWSQIYIPEKQVHLIHLIDNIENKNKLTSKYIQECICKKFPPHIINSNDELKINSIHLIRFGYKDGMQIFHGPSRDYRGEAILFDNSTLEYYIGRVSLPVFPDYTDIRKDPASQKLIETCNQFHIIPKYDGSLFVLSFIKINTPQYFIIKKLLPQVSTQAWFENHLGIWCFGSKSCMFAKNQIGDKGVLSRINNSIKASYNSIENFINVISLEIQNNNFINLYLTFSLVFEAIDKNPTDELTVDYGKSFCPFLCWIIWDDIKKEKKIVLPFNILYLNPVAQIITCDTWDKVIQFKEQAHVRLLEGSQIDEPEGYVVWFENTNIAIKLKHLEYYIAHKPYSKKNISMAKHIEFSEEYSKLRTRLIKFKPKPPIKDLIKNDFALIMNLFLNNCEYLNSKKNWVLFWKENSNIIKINELLEIIEINVVTFYPQFLNSLKDKGFSLAMDYFDKKDDLINYFYSKYFKI